MNFRSRAAACAVIVAALGTRVFVSQEQAPREQAPEYKTNLPVDHPAIPYGRSPADDPVSRLQRELGRTGETLGSGSAVLRSLLDRLGIAVDTQMLVFSKTSFQAARISPRQPRAIYFNDDVAVAYVPGAPGLEIAAVDPVQGPIFYTVSVEGSKPAIARGETCLKCHHGPNTAGVPGIYVGSVIPGPTGAPLAGESAIITDHRSAFSERWGGWYVTATRGEQPDRANAIASNPADPETLVRDSRQNLTSLAGFFDPSPYPAATSDIVALMTFEHQTQMTNLLTRVAWDVRIGSAELQLRPGSAGLQPRPGRAELQVATGNARSQANGERNADLQVRSEALDADIEDLVRYMLFSGEAPLKEPIEGVSSFTRTFSQRGPRDGGGRSLRDFDLKTRLFRYPLSYMIYSAQFDALPQRAREQIYRRLYAVLSGADHSQPFAYLSADDRSAILAILRDTKRGLPDYWRAGPPTAERRSYRHLQRRQDP